MFELPETPATPLVRTDFSDDAAWRALAEDATKPSAHGFRANLHLIDDRRFNCAASKALLAAAKPTGHQVLFVADAVTLGDAERPILCLSLGGEGAFRVVPSELSGVENNLSLANMDFEEFANAVDADGVFRGFR